MLNPLRFLLLIACFWALEHHVGLSHDAHYKNSLLRQWNRPNGDRLATGSFTVQLDSNIWIENERGIHVSLKWSDLSPKDQNYLALKSKEIKNLNQGNTQASKSLMANVNTPNTRRTFVLILLFATFLIALIVLEYNIGLTRVHWKYFRVSGILIIAVFLLQSSQSRYLNTPLASTSPSFIDSAFLPFKPQVYTFWNNNYFYVSSLGIPTTHPMMVGISSHGWQQQVPIPQCYIGNNSWPIPLNPVPALNPIPVDNVHFTRGAIAIAVNGVPIFNVFTNTGVDSYLDGQLDQYGGHCGRADDYHYHLPPLHLSNFSLSHLPIAFGLDGYPVYGALEPDGALMQALDLNHGHQYGGNYHYHGTPTSPYMIARMAGQVTEDINHQLVPQAVSRGVRPALTPLNGALITGCLPNASQNGYQVAFTRNNNNHTIDYQWTNTGQYSFAFKTNGILDSSRVYNGLAPCSVPTFIDILNHDNLTDRAFEIYPNPNIGLFRIEWNHELAVCDSKKIIIRNAQGEIVLETNDREDIIDLKGEKQGLYYIIVVCGDKSWFNKIILND